MVYPCFTFKKYTNTYKFSFQALLIIMLQYYKHTAAAVYVDSSKLQLNISNSMLAL
jgi:hypothetical protein